MPSWEAGEGTAAAGSVPAGRATHEAPEQTTQLATEDLRVTLTRLASLSRAVDDAERINQIEALERIKSACAAAQARVTDDLRASRAAAEEAAGVPPEERGRGLGSEIALARRESPHKGSRLLGLARALAEEMPHTLAALTRGDINEWRATILVRETAALEQDARREVDARLATRMPGLGDRALAAAAKGIACELDPNGIARRAARAETERRVTLRPAPDAMSYLTALVPVTSGVAMYAALTKHADAVVADGDDPLERSRGQIMADTLVERVTGRVRAGEVPIHVGLVMSDATLCGGGSEPAWITGFGPVPAPVARRMLRVDQRPYTDGQAPETEPDYARRAGVWIRRLYTSPGTGELVAMDSQSRYFESNLRAFILGRDDTCRTPWCDAPIRHADHVMPYADGGPTSAGNGQGLCVRCNQAKEAPGWRTAPVPAIGHPRGAVRIITPTGHRHIHSPPPVLPGTGPDTRQSVDDATLEQSALERHLERLLRAA